MKKLFFFLVLTSFVACNNENAGSGNTDTPADSPEVTETRTYNQVLEVHDNIMAKSGPMQKMAFKLKDWSEEATEAQASSINAAIALISQAEESMNSWMEQLGKANPATLRESLNHEEIMEVLALQEENGAIVAKQYQEAFDQASQVLSTISGEKGISLTPPSN